MLFGTPYFFLTCDSHHHLTLFFFFSPDISRRPISTMSSSQDFELAALATGFTIGFGFLTVWEAVKQTRRNRNRLRSAYIYMIWGEIAVNAAIVIIGWLFLHGKLGPT